MQRAAGPGASAPTTAAGPVPAGYRLEGLIGAGAVGEVHRATALATGAAVALKIVPLGDAARGGTPPQRFVAEVGAAQRLQHPDIVRLLDAGTTGPRGWIAMELLAGCNLERYTRPARLLPEPVVLDLVIRVAQALAHAHSQGVVHRDVKPANVIVDWAAGRVTLTDFGVAHLADGERTRTGIVLGTPAYMAPEQLAGASASAAGDLYALGVLLFELLCGRRPHEATTMGELLRRVASEAAPDLRLLRPDLPAALAAEVATLLAKAPAARGSSAPALAGRLQALRAAWPPAGGGPKSRA